MKTATEMISNYPFAVNFAGLRGTLKSMQNNGWQISAEQIESFYDYSISLRIAGYHPILDLKCLSMPYRLDKMLFLREGLNNSFYDSISFELKVCSKQIAVNIIENEKFNFFPMDASRHDIYQMPEKHIYALEELVIFKPLNNNLDIYLPEQDILKTEQYLEKILENQKEKQAEIRKKIIDQRLRHDTKALKDELKIQLVAI